MTKKQQLKKKRERGRKEEVVSEERTRNIRKEGLENWHWTSID